MNTIPERFDDADGGDDPGADDDHDEHDEQDLDQCHRHDTGGIQVEIFRKSAASAFQTFANTWKYFKHTCEHVHSAHFKTQCLQFLHTTLEHSLWQNLTTHCKVEIAHSAKWK